MSLLYEFAGVKPSSLTNHYAATPNFWIKATQHYMFGNASYMTEN